MLLKKYDINCFNLVFLKKIITTSFVTKTKSDTLKHNLKLIRKNNEATSIPDYIKKVFKSDEEHEIIHMFSHKLLKKKPTPKSLYVAHPEAKSVITKYFKRTLNKGDTVMEINPGPWVLSSEIIKSDASNIILIEEMDEFVKQLQSKYGTKSGRVKIKNGNALSLWKLVYKDKLDQGRRFDELFSDVPKKQFNDDPNMKVLGCVMSLNFFKHLINSLVFGGSWYSYGRSEMYLIVPPTVYIHLTCSKEAGYLLYRSTSILFQIFFEYQFMAKIRREYFLPWSYETDLSNYKKLKKYKIIDPTFLYLIRIIPRKNLFELCPPENIQALWYFVRQCCISRKNRVIPTLEKWIPGCGPRLLVNANKAETVQELFSEDNDIILPKFSKPCTTLSKQDYYSSLDIFTEFGDLTPSQIFTLFSLFRSWPEYKESSFLASLENCLLKIGTSDAENVDDIEISEDNLNKIHSDEMFITSDIKNENQ